MSETLSRAARVAAVGVRAAVATSSLPAEIREAATLYLLVTGCNLPGAQVGRLVGCSKQNVSKRIARVEAAREVTPIDLALAELEQQLFGDW